MTAVTELTLSEIASLLGEPQHRLIHLCEKGAVIPDIEDARGRGASRRFSRRNVFEFALALKLRQMMLPVAVAAAVVRVLRAFERYVTTKIRSFSLPDGLRGRDAPDLRVILSDGRLLYFALGRAATAPKLFGGIDIRTITSAGKGRIAPPIREISHSRAARRPRASGGDDFGTPEGSKHTRVEVSVTRIAQDLPLD